MSTRAVLAISILGALAAAPTNAEVASPAAELVIGTGEGAIACYSRADSDGLERAKALQLCLGADSDAPARCLLEAIDRLALDDLRAIRLCRTATSVEPATCAERLDDLGFTSNQTVRYCAQLAWPLVPVSGAGSPACVARGLEETALSEPELVRLCRGAETTAPIRCFQSGVETTDLADRDVVSLCAAVMVSAPTAPLRR